MGSRRESLNALVEEAYNLFAGRQPTDHGCCKNCCMYAEVEARFLTWAPRDIPLDDLRDWYFAAYDTPFPRETMRWALPRIFELLSEGADIADVGNEVVLQRLAASGFPTDWTDREVDLVTRFATELIVATACGEIGYGNLDRLEDALCMVGLGGVDLAPAIARLDDLPTEALIDLFEPGGIRLTMGVNPFWESGPSQDMVFGWPYSKQMLDRMMAYGVGSAGSQTRRDAALNIADAILNWRERTGLA